MTVSFHALWMLCALGVTVFAAVAARRGIDLAGLAAGLIVGSVGQLFGWTADIVLAGGLAAAVAAGFLFRPRWSPFLAAGGGVLAGVWMNLLRAQGVPLPAGLAIVFGVMTLSVVLARRRPGFAPEVLREEALLTILLFGTAVAMLPSVLDGWSAAANLTGTPASDAEAAIPVWALALVGVSLTGGAAHALWSRR